MYFGYFISSIQICKYLFSCCFDCGTKNDVMNQHEPAEMFRVDKPHFIHLSFKKSQRNGNFCDYISIDGKQVL